MYEFTIEYAVQRGEDLRREGEHFRFAEQARAANPRPRIYAPLLAAAGRRLAALGALLERRYASTATPPLSICEVTQWN